MVWLSVGEGRAGRADAVAATGSGRQQRVSVSDRAASPERVDDEPTHDTRDTTNKPATNGMDGRQATGWRTDDGREDGVTGQSSSGDRCGCGDCATALPHSTAAHHQLSRHQPRRAGRVNGPDGLRQRRRMSGRPTTAAAESDWTLSAARCRCRSRCRQTIVSARLACCGGKADGPLRGHALCPIDCSADGHANG